MSMIVESSRKRRKVCKVKKGGRRRGTLSSVRCVDEDEDESYCGVRKGDSIDILSLLFSKSRDFLITNNNTKVKADELRGKAILIYMVSLELHEPDALLSETFHLREAYDELRPTGSFEVVLVPVERGRLRARAQDRFNACFSHMPWPAIPFSDKLACDRLQYAIRGSSPHSQHSFWSIFDPTGKYLLCKWYPNDPFFTYYGGLKLVPFTDRLALFPSFPTDLDPAIKGIIDLHQILASPRRDFLLTNNNNKVPISSLKDKVVGLYICGCIPDPPRMEAIKKICLSSNLAASIISLGSPCLSKTPAFVGSFEFSNASMEHDIIQHFGIEAYPFTRKRVFELELARRKQELNLELIFHPNAPPLLRGGCCDQVPASYLWGKRVLILFATHSQCKAGSFVPYLKEKYLKQEECEFEVVYISNDHNRSTFDECTRKMPWLVHPYSPEFARQWRSKIFFTKGEVALASFHVDGELLSKSNNLECVPRRDYHSTSGHVAVNILKDYPFTLCHMEIEILRDVSLKYKLQTTFFGDVFYIFRFR